MLIDHFVSVHCGSIPSGVEKSGVVESGTLQYKTLYTLRRFGYPKNESPPKKKKKKDVLISSQKNSNLKDWNSSSTARRSDSHFTRLPQQSEVKQNVPDSSSDTPFPIYTR